MSRNRRRNGFNNKKRVKEPPRNMHQKETKDEQARGDSAGNGPQGSRGVEDIEELRKKAALADEYFSLLQRLQAEFDNYRKRIKREEAGLFHRAIEGILEDLVEVMDLFDRALEEKHAADVPQAYREGIELVYRVLGDVLARRGLSRIKARGEAFDPNLHEAAMVEKNKEVMNGTVVDEIRPGYMLGERLLRASVVKVSQGGPPRLGPEAKETADKASTEENG